MAARTTVDGTHAAKTQPKPTRFQGHAMSATQTVGLVEPFTAFTVRGQPPYIRDLSTAPHPYGLIAYGLLREEGLLRRMCFDDNEHGTGAARDVHIISSRVVGNVNALFAKWQRPLRVFGLAPHRARHHHIEVHWCFVDSSCVCTESTQFHMLILNLYPLSKRTPTEETDRSEPTRGFKRGRKSKDSEMVEEPADLDA
jgi:hypothetical protein